jgi:pimeloyl-ACP methyl ester carboxylesterase
MDLVSLPIDRHLDAVARELSLHGSLVLVAEPGAGKTTRMPSGLVERSLAGQRGQVVVLQPRRIAARTAALRIAQEHGDELGGFAGYQVRFDSKLSARTRVRVITEGLLIRELQRDPSLPGVSVVLLDSIAFPQNIPVFFRLLDVPRVSQLGVRMVPPSVQARVALRIAYFDDSKIDPEEVELYAAPLKTAAGKHAIIHSARQIVPEDIAELSERYKTIELPTLILWCDHDRIVPLEVGIKLRRTLPNSTLRLVEDCGHMPQEEQPASTLSLILGFIGG